MNQTNEICTRLPNALAYRVKVRPEGSLPCIKLLSRRATADCVVPIRAATSACVRPTDARAAMILSSSASSALASSHSLRKFGSSSDSFSMSRQVLVAFIFQFLHTRPCNLQLLLRCFLVLLYKCVQHHNLFPDLSAIEGSSYPFFRSSSQFKKAITHCLREFVGKVTPHDFHSLKQRKSSSSNPVRESFYQQTHVFIKELNNVAGRRNCLSWTDCRRRGLLLSFCRHETPVEIDSQNYSKKAIIITVLLMLCAFNTAFALTLRKQPIA